jgi:C-terminal processing protease CtpA/Prc
VRSDDALAQIVDALVTPLRDAHVHLSRPDGSLVSPYVPLGTINWVRSSWDASVSKMSAGRQGTGWRSARVTTTGGDVGYLALTTWATGQISADDVDAALETLRDTRALVLDVRMNGGGNDAIAFAVAGRFATRTVTFGTVQTRSGPAHTDFTAPEPRTVAPRGAWQYTKPVYLLVGRGVFSSAESFAAALGELPQVTIAGDTTGGASGNPREFALRVGNRDTGWHYTVSTWVETLTNGRPIEGIGIAPDVVVPFAFNPAQPTTDDPVIAWAIDRARAP